MALRGPRPKYFAGPHYTYSTKPKDPLIRLKSIVSESFYFMREIRNQLHIGGCSLCAGAVYSIIYALALAQFFSFAYSADP